MRHVLALSLLLSATSAHAVKLADLKPFGYQVRFTNPVCREYRYDAPVLSVSGERLVAKPRGAYCKPGDAALNADRPESPQFGMIQAIRDPSVKEIFFAFLSFSNDVVGRELCRAADRGVKITFVLDGGTELASAKKLQACGGANNHPKLHLRGSTGGLGYAHNKLMLFNPADPTTFRAIFGSGNLSSGVILHHENWHFVTTTPKSHFAQAHLCLARGMLEAGESAAQYAKFIDGCRRAIAAPEEEDVRSFFVPGQGDEATRLVLAGVKAAKEVSVAAHRFSYGALQTALEQRLRAGGKVRFVGDDDLHWAAVGEPVGPNTADEAARVARLAKAGAGVRFLETNHADHLLHHNKFLVFDDRAVFAGAGNLTNAGFTKNFENFYFITIPEVARAFRTQYEHLYGRLATSPERLPRENILP